MDGLAGLVHHISNGFLVLRIEVVFEFLAQQAIQHQVFPLVGLYGPQEHGGVLGQGQRGQPRRPLLFGFFRLDRVNLLENEGFLLVLVKDRGYSVCERNVIQNVFLSGEVFSKGQGGLQGLFGFQGGKL